MSRHQNRYQNWERVGINHGSGRWLSLQLFLAFLCFALIAIWLYLPLNSALVERIYSQSIYTQIAKFLVPLNSIVSFPLTLISLLVFLVLAIFNLARAIIYGTFTRWLVGLLFSISLICVWFFIAWGANYQRLTVSEILELNTVQVASDAVNQEKKLLDLADYLLHVIERDVGEARASETANADAIASISVAMTGLLEQNDINIAYLSKLVKFWPKGTLLVGFSASGVMLPWFIEPTVDAGLADADLVAVAAHELAHAAGFATEGDADFIGTIAALSADNAYGRYSAALRAYRNISQDLSADAKAKLDLRLPPLAKSDWNDAYNAYLKYQAPDWLKKSNQGVYDTYLQSQGVEAGIKDYARSTQILILAMQKGLLP